MDTKFEVDRMKVGRFKGLYYLVAIIGNKKLYDEIDITELIEIEFSSFMVDMTIQYKGEEMSGNLFFKDKEDASRAIDEYVIPKYIMNRLVNS